MSTGNGRHKPPPLPLDAPPRTPSTRTQSSSSGSAARSPPPQSPKDQRKHSKSSGIRGFFGVKEPSAAAFEKMAKQQRIETAKRGLQQPSGVTTGQISPKQVDEDMKRQEAAARRKAKLHEQKRQEQRSMTQVNQAMYQQEPITYHTLDPAAQPGGSYTVAAPPLRAPDPYSPPLRPTYTPGSPRHMKLPSLDAVLEGNPVQYHKRTTSSASNSTLLYSPSVKSSASSTSTALGSEVQRKLAAPWEDDEIIDSSAKKKGVFGFGRR